MGGPETINTNINLPNSAVAGLVKLQIWRIKNIIVIALVRKTIKR